MRVRAREGGWRGWSGAERASKLTSERDWLVSKLLRPSSARKGQLFWVRCTAEMYLKE